MNHIEKIIINSKTIVGFWWRLLSEKNATWFIIEGAAQYFHWHGCTSQMVRQTLQKLVERSSLYSVCKCKTHGCVEVK